MFPRYLKASWIVWFNSVVKAAALSLGCSGLLGSSKPETAGFSVREWARRGWPLREDLWSLSCMKAFARLLLMLKGMLVKLMSSCSVTQF